MTNTSPTHVHIEYSTDADGNIVSADYSELDEYMAARAPHGTPMFHSLVSLSGPGESFDPIWRRAYGEAVRQFAAHVREIGFGYDDFALWCYRVINRPPREVTESCKAYEHE